MAYVVDMITSRIQPKLRETATSFLSRMAASHRVSTTDFAWGMGISYRKITAFDRDAINSVAKLGGLSSAAQDEMVSWSGVADGNVRTLYRGETVVSRALKNPIVWGCPKCLQEDASEAPDTPTTAMSMRGHWQFRHVTACLKHSSPLVRLWDRSVRFQRFNIQERLSEISDNLLAGHLDQKQIELTEFDHWLDGRLGTKQDTTWLASQNMYAASTFCYHLGQLLLPVEERRQAPSITSQRKGNALAFGIVKDGFESINACLTRLVNKSTSNQHEPTKVFSSLYVTLRDTYKADSTFDPFKDILRSSIIANFPLEAGTEILGKTVKTRSLHSISSGAIEAGVGTQLMGKILADVGAISLGETRRPARTMFDAEKYAGLITDIQTWITKEQMKEVLGATKREFAALVDEGLINSATRVTTYAAVWRPYDAEFFLNKLDDFSKNATENTHQMINLLHARTLTKRPIKEIIALIESGEVDLLKVASGLGLQNYMLSREQIEGFRPTQTAVKDKNSPSPAEFFRSVGIRDASEVKTLIDNGLISISGRDLGKNSSVTACLTEQDISQFSERYFTLTMLSKRTGHHRNSLRTLLKKNSVEPISSDGRRIAGLFSFATLPPTLQKELWDERTR